MSKKTLTKLTPITQKQQIFLSCPSLPREKKLFSRLSTFSTLKDYVFYYYILL